MDPKEPRALGIPGATKIDLFVFTTFFCVGSITFWSIPDPVYDDWGQVLQYLSSIVVGVILGNRHPSERDSLVLRAAFAAAWRIAAWAVLLSAAVESILTGNATITMVQFVSLAVSNAAMVFVSFYASSWIGRFGTEDRPSLRGLWSPLAALAGWATVLLTVALAPPSDAPKDLRIEVPDGSVLSPLVAPILPSDSMEDGWQDFFSDELPGDLPDEDLPAERGP